MLCGTNMKRFRSSFILPNEHDYDENTIVVLRRQKVLFIVYVICLFFTVSSLLMAFSLWNWLALLCMWFGYSAVLIYSL